MTRKGMQISRAYKVELDPNNKQRTALVQHCGAARHVYNWGLEQKQAAYKTTGKSPGAMELHRKLNELKQVSKEDGGKPWLYETSKCAGQEALRDLDRAFSNFFRRCKQGAKRKGFPRFKSRKRGLGSFRLTGAIRSLGSHVQLPRLGKIRLKECGYLPTPENKDVKVLSATVTERAGRWFVSFAVKEEIPDPKPKAKAKPVGVDVGVSFLATCSDGVVYESPETKPGTSETSTAFRSSRVTACGEISSGSSGNGTVKLASKKQEPNRRPACLDL